MFKAKCGRKFFRLFSFTLTTIVMSGNLPGAFAQGNNGGGGTTTPARFSVVQLPALSLGAYDVTNTDVNGFVIVAGEAAEGAYVSAAVAKIHVASKAVVSFLLPEPTDGMSLDADSNAYNVNQAGTIVGSASVFEGAIDNDHRVGKPCRWLPDGNGYRHQQLPLLAGESYGVVSNINDLGWMIGRCGTGANSSAALWSPNGTEVFAVELALPADSGWSRMSVESINNLNQIAGSGWLDGAPAGFVMDLVVDIDPDTSALLLSSTFEKLNPPLGAERNFPISISDSGEIVGDAIFVDGSTRGIFQTSAMDAVQLLPSATTGGGDAFRRNASNQIVGTSFLPTADNTGTRYVGTLWEPKAGGGFTATALEKLVPTKPVWRITGSVGINEQGCITARARKYDKGKYTWMSALLIPNQ